MQGYALGRNAAGHADDAEAFLEQAVTLTDGTSRLARGEYAFARGLADGARQWAADTGTLFAEGVASAPSGPAGRS